MSDRPVQTPSGADVALTGPSPEEVAKFKAKAVEIFSRGVVQDALNVALPDGLVGQWVRNDNKAIAEAKIYGFVEDTEYAVKNALHNDGSGRAGIGDCIFMVQPKWQADALEDVRREKFFKQHGFKTGGHMLQEEREYLVNDGPIKTFSDSSMQVTTVSKGGI